MNRPIACLVSIGLLVFASISVAAQDASSPAAGEPTVAAAAVGQLPESPAGEAVLRLLRVTIQPGGALPLNPGRQEAVAALVDAGEVAVHFEFDALLEPSVGADPIPVAPGTVVTIPVGSGFYAGKDTTFTMLNLSSQAAVVLLGLVEPSAWAPPGVVSRYINFSLVQSEVLAVGVLEELPAAPIVLGIAILVYEPGQGDTAVEAVGGPSAAYVESGEFSYTLGDGVVELTRAAGEGMPASAEILAPGSTTTLRAGDAIFEHGASTMVRNEGADPAIVVLVVVRQGVF
jgi:hypothetical protein